MTTSSVEIARRLARLERRLAALGGPQLAFSSIEDGAVNEYDIDGQLSSTIGKQYDGTHGAVTLVSPKPLRPVLTSAETVPGGVLVTWEGGWEADPSTVNPSLAPTPPVAPLDFQLVEVHASTSSPAEGFTGLFFGTKRGEIVSARGGQVLIPVGPQATVYVRLVARTVAGRPSDPSDAVGPVAGGLLPAEYVDIDLSNVGGGTTIWYGPDDPEDPQLGDMWLKEPEHHAYRLGLSDLGAPEWVDQRDTSITQALQDALDAANAATAAQTTAASKAAVFAQASAPSATDRTVGDVWIDTDDGNRWYDWPAGASPVWTARPLGQNALSPIVGDNLLTNAGLLRDSGNPVGRAESWVAYAAGTTGTVTRTITATGQRVQAAAFGTTGTDYVGIYQDVAIDPNLKRFKASVKVNGTGPAGSTAFISVDYRSAAGTLLGTQVATLPIASVPVSQPVAANLIFAPAAHTFTGAVTARVYLGIQGGTTAGAGDITFRDASFTYADAITIPGGSIGNTSIQPKSLVASDVIATGTISGALLKADAIDGKTITGALIRTAASGQRIQMDSAMGLIGYDPSGTAVTSISPATGLLTATGATITGELRTAASGARMRMLQAGGVGTLEMYGGTAAETPASITNTVVAGDKSLVINYGSLYGSTTLFGPKISMNAESDTGTVAARYIEIDSDNTVIRGSLSIPGPAGTVAESAVRKDYSDNRDLMFYRTYTPSSTAIPSGGYRQSGVGTDPAIASFNLPNNVRVKIDASFRIGVSVQNTGAVLYYIIVDGTTLRQGVHRGTDEHRVIFAMKDYFAGVHTIALRVEGFGGAAIWYESDISIATGVAAT